jgi:rfaE bifunctional protein kinase chain/domain
MKLPNFSKVKVLVIGDVMLDRYMFGTVDRISPEAPVPVVHLKETRVAVGGAANVAANVVGLGAKVTLVGAVGEDFEAEELKNALRELDISPEFLLNSAVRKTSVKTRVVAQNHHIVRIDQETVLDLIPAEEEAICATIDELLDDVDVVLISDYAKGFLTNKIITEVIKKGTEKSKHVVVDPKAKDFSKYRGATLLTPNRKEALEARLVETTDLKEIGQNLLTSHDFASLLITEGEDGMTLFRDDQIDKFSSVARKVYDVTGAGDTVIATLSVALGCGMDIIESVRLANLAAGIVVESVGTTRITFSDLEKLSA